MSQDCQHRLIGHRFGPATQITTAPGIRRRAETPLTPNTVTHDRTGRNLSPGILSLRWRNFYACNRHVLDKKNDCLTVSRARGLNCGAAKGRKQEAVDACAPSG